MKKVFGILVVIGILFSYLPVIPMDSCPEGGHPGNTQMECGYAFHCPFLFGINGPESMPLPLLGRLVLASSMSKPEEWPHLIFHPPKC